MKVGFTPQEAYDMFRPLRKEVFSYFNYDRPLSFGTRPWKSGIFDRGTIAHTDFSEDPETPWNPLKRINEYASGIRMSADYLAHLYEDELICVLLHELAHVTAGFSSQHGSEWQRHAAEVGAVPEAHFLIRNWRNMTLYSPGSPEWMWARSHPGPTMEVYAGSL